MRTHFDLKESEPLMIRVGDKSYRFSRISWLAQKHRRDTLVSEQVFKTEDGQHVFLTIVGDDDQYGKNGLYRGWYVAEVISEKDALWTIDAMSKFTEHYR